MKHILITIAAVLLVGCGKPSSLTIKPLTQNDIILLEAVKENNLDAVKKAITDGADINAAEDNSLRAGYDFRNTALILSIDRGRTEITKFLISSGADVNKRGSRGGTPLDSAKLFNRTESIELLLKHGAKTSVELKAAGK